MIRLIVLHGAVLVSAAWLIRQAFFARPGSFLSWPMYNSVSFFRAALFDEDTGERVVPWRDQIHIDHGGGYYALEEYLDFLTRERGTTVRGHGVVGGWQLDERFDVRNGVLDR